MQIKLVTVLSCIAFCGVSLAQNRQSPDEDINHFVERYDTAWNRRDAAGIKRNLAADYIYFTSKGATKSREQMVDKLLSPKYTLASAQRSEVKEKQGWQVLSEHCTQIVVP